MGTAINIDPAFHTSKISKHLIVPAETPFENHRYQTSLKKKKKKKKHATVTFFLFDHATVTKERKKKKTIIIKGTVHMNMKDG